MNTLSKENRQVGCELISLNIKLKKIKVSIKYCQYLFAVNEKKIQKLQNQFNNEVKEIEFLNTVIEYLKVYREKLR